MQPLRQIIRAGAAVALAGLVALPLPAKALTLLRDADIEHALSELAKPVLAAAGLAPSRIRVLVINDRNLNAFVVDNRHVFIHSGMISRLDNAAALQAVIAHEAAHIANGHIARRTINARNAKNVTGIGIALAAAAAASGNSNAAGALSIGIASSANRVLLSHTRAEESSADQASVRYLARAGIDPQAAAQVMEIFAGQELVSAARQDPYARTHPMSRDRLRHIKALAASYGAGNAKSTATADYWFARAKGKLTAFQRAPKWTRRRAAESPAEDIRLMRLAIADHRDSRTAKAIAGMKTLIARKPRDPYYHELMGQILLESRRLPSAIAAYRKAAQLAPRNALILGGLGHALLVSGDARGALPVLEKARARDGADGRVLRDLAQAYAKAGKSGMAALVTAERYALQGRFEDAGIHAKRASGLLPRGSAGWQRAQDVLSAAEAATRK